MLKMFDFVQGSTNVGGPRGIKISKKYSWNHKYNFYKNINFIDTGYCNTNTKMS